MNAIETKLGRKLTVGEKDMIAAILKDSKVRAYAYGYVFGKAEDAIAMAEQRKLEVVKEMTEFYKAK